MVHTTDSTVHVLYIKNVPGTSNPQSLNGSILTLSQQSAGFYVSSVKVLCEDNYTFLAPLFCKKTSRYCAMCLTGSSVSLSLLN